MIALRVLLTESSIADVAGRPAGLAPGGRALRRRRQIAGLAGARVTESHRQDGDAGFIVKHRLVHAQPIAQALAAGVVERQAGRVHAPPGAWPAIRMRASGCHCNTGRGPSGRLSAHSRQARTSCSRPAASMRVAVYSTTPTGGWSWVWPTDWCGSSNSCAIASRSAGWRCGRIRWPAPLGV